MAIVIVIVIPMAMPMAIPGMTLKMNSSPWRVVADGPFSGASRCGRNKEMKKKNEETKKNKEKSTALNSNSGGRMAG